MGRAGLSPVMVGRAEELDTLRACVQGLAGHRGLPPVAMVSGEAGVGKTRLLREMAAELAASQPGVQVLVGNAEEGGDARAFSLLADALSRIVATWDPIPEPLSGWAHALGHVLAPLLPEHSPDADHEHTSEELLLAAVDAIRHVVGAGPAVIVLEALHWADAESLALLGRLATTEDLPLVLVGTYRPEDFDRRHPLARMLTALERQRSITHLWIGRLDGEELSRMLEAVLGRAVPHGTVDVLHRRTQGNPFFVEELIAVADGVDPVVLAEAPLPWNAAEAVLRRVDELEPAARRTLEAAAILGGRVPFDRLGAVAAMDEDALIGTLRELVERGLLRESEPDVFAFRHALTREAVVSQLLGREQRRLHRAALAALEEEGGSDFAAIARHAAGAGEWERLAEAALVGAPRLRSEGAARQALALSELALERGDNLPAEQQLALHSVAARSAWEIGALETSLRHAVRWAELARAAGDLEQESEARRREWLVRYELGDRSGAEEALEAAIVAAGALGPSVELAWAQAFVSQSHMLSQRHAETLAWADRALELAARLGAPEVMPYALVNKGTVLLETGQAEEGLALLEQARAAALERHDGATAARALNNASWFLLDFTDEPERARPLLEEMKRTVDRYGQEGYRGNLALGTALLALVDGDLEMVRRALERTDGIEDVVITGLLLGLRALVAAESGDPHAALAALSPLPRPEDVRGEETAWLSQARIALGARAGDLAAITEGVTVLRATAGVEQASRWLPQIGPQAVILAAHTSVEDGLLTELLEAAAHVDAGPRVPGDVGLLAHAEAALLARRGDHAAAVEAFGRAEAGRPRARPAFLRADREVGLARSLDALGRREEAAAHAGEAVRLLQRWPGWRHDQAVALRDGLTGGGGKEGTGGLTPREVEVLRLVADGLSNREIGERLYITTKTAAVHVSNILAKVGAASRTEAATWALRTGALETDSSG
jgi:DNA-binding CsgD family transcriptional regulator/tetratricopeptide (TPR) repeat protein